MAAHKRALHIAYLHYGLQSGVTPQIWRALAECGHTVTPCQVSGPFEFRGEDGRRRVSWKGLAHLTMSALQYGRQAKAHRWNTSYAFDGHSQRAAELLDALPDYPDLVLQNGALFAPGRPPAFEYALLLDHTRALSMRLREHPVPGLPPPVDYGPGWHERETELYRAARAIATFSRQVATSLSRDYGVPSGRIHVVGAGANVFPERIERRDDGETILFVGKDFRRKGGLVLLRAFERVRRERPSAKLIIVGPSERLTLPPGAFQLEFTPPERLVRVFAEATVFALPTLKEPFGLAFLDAMACGLPCVGTHIEAVPEIIQHGNTGLLVPPGDAEALAEAVLQVLREPESGRKMGLRGRQRVEARFTWGHTGRRLEQALLSAVSSIEARRLTDEQLA